VGAQGTGDIEIRNLSNHAGLIPVKLGSAKIQESTYNLIHYFNLDELILEIGQLDNKSDNLTLVLESNKYYRNDSLNHLKILGLIKNKVNIKLHEILPNYRVKRGLINGLGSIFKSISGNLDATDGERYDKLIKQLEQNQQKIADNLIKQNAISLNVIDQFNNTVSKIISNQKILENKISEIFANFRF